MVKHFLVWKDVLLVPIRDSNSIVTLFLLFSETSSMCMCKYLWVDAG